MAGGTDVDLVAMDAMAGRLGESADALDAVGNGSPGVPDAGEVTGIMGSAIALLTESAGNLVLGLRGASELLGQARRDYASQDQSSARSLRGY
jgi:hypothetical protein